MKILLWVNRIVNRFCVFKKVWDCGGDKMNKLVNKDGMVGKVLEILDLVVGLGCLVWFIEFLSFSFYLKVMFY